MRYLACSPEAVMPFWFIYLLARVLTAWSNGFNKPFCVLLELIGKALCRDLAYESHKDLISNRAKHNTAVNVFSLNYFGL